MMPISVPHSIGRVFRGRVVLPVLALLWGIDLLGLHPWLMNWGADI
jgi:hypothetical protein